MTRILPRRWVCFSVYYDGTNIHTVSHQALTIVIISMPCELLQELLVTEGLQYSLCFVAVIEPHPPDAMIALNLLGRSPDISMYHSLGTMRSHVPQCKPLHQCHIVSSVRKEKTILYTIKIIKSKQQVYQTKQCSIIPLLISAFVKALSYIRPCAQHL